MARNLAIQIPRALGPPVARGLIDIWGRTGGMFGGARSGGKKREGKSFYEF